MLPAGPGGFQKPITLITPWRGRATGRGMARGPIWAGRLRPACRWGGGDGSRVLGAGRAKWCVRSAGRPAQTVSQDKHYKVTLQVRNLRPRALSCFVSIADLDSVLAGLNPTPLGSKAFMLSIHRPHPPPPPQGGRVRGL